MLVAPTEIAEGEADMVHVGTGGVVVTVSTSEQVTLPPGPVNCAEYVVVVVGDTVTEPESAVAVKPPESHVIVVAFVLFHVTVAVLPVCIASGETVSEHVGAGGGGVFVTVTVPLHVDTEVPSLFTTRSVYVVVVDGDTVAEPLTAVLVIPPLNHDRVLALVVLHVTTAD